MKFDVVASLAGLPLFLAYFGAAVLLLVVFVVLYAMLTPYPEFKLIRGGNVAASVSLGGAVIGFVLPLCTAIQHAASFLDMLVWALVAMAVQILAYTLVRLTVPGIAREVSQGHVASGIWLGVVAAALGALDAACMTP